MAREAEGRNVQHYQLTTQPSLTNELVDDGTENENNVITELKSDDEDDDRHESSNRVQITSSSGKSAGAMRVKSTAKDN